MKLNIQDPDQVRSFLILVAETEPEIADECSEVIQEMAEETLVPVSRIKRLAREKTTDHQVAMARAVAVAEATLVCNPASCLLYTSPSPRDRG